MRFKSLLAIVLFITMSCLILNTNAKTIEKILVIANDEIITQTEFEERLAKTREMFKQVYKYDDKKLADEVEQVKPQILETMIDEILFVQEAMKRNIQVSDNDVLKEIDALKKQFATDKEFTDALEAEGYTIDTLKREKKRTLLLQELIKQKFTTELVVADDEIYKFYQENRDQFPGREDTVKLKHILIKYNLTQANRDEAKQKAELALKQCLDGADFTEMVEKFSDDPGTKANKGDMGYFMPGAGQFPEIEDAASKLGVGQISNLIETPDGYDIIKITDKNNEGQIKAQIIHIAVWANPEEEKAIEEKVNSIVQELKNGANFVEMVKKYSDDTLTKEKDGDWMDIPIENMGADLRGAFDTFEVGVISRPIKTPQGIHIFQIAEKKKLTDAEVEQIRKFLSEKKLQDKLSEYSAKLKESAYIRRFEISN
jgi:peptidyl-prolyl cis-trans isomerase SurA